MNLLKFLYNIVNLKKNNKTRCWIGNKEASGHVTEKSKVLKNPHTIPFKKVNYKISFVR